MVQEGQDISVNAAIKHAVGFQAHLADLIDRAFAPTILLIHATSPSDAALAIYLRESPDISGLWAAPKRRWGAFMATKP